VLIRPPGFANRVEEHSQYLGPLSLVPVMYEILPVPPSKCTLLAREKKTNRLATEVNPNTLGEGPKDWTGGKFT